MTDDVRLAFAHPIERAVATAGEDPADRIMLRDHIRDVEIGAFQAERGTRQRVKFNVVVEVAPLGDLQDLDDDVDRILSYDALIEAIDYELGAERLNLLETLAARIAERVLLSPLAQRVFVRIEKLDKGPFTLGVEIVRSQTRAPIRPVEDEALPHPRVVLLSNTAIGDTRLAGFLDALVATDMPAILCVGLGDMPAPQVGHPMAQRRVDLLAMEQNAWALAARDARCVVVESRTELDWGLKNGQLSVWAPSRLVLDATDKPESHAPGVLALWLAEHFHGAEVVSVGLPLPEGAGLPVRVLAELDAAAL